MSYVWSISIGIAYKIEIILKVWSTQIIGAWKEIEWLSTPLLNY